MTRPPHLHFWGQHTLRAGASDMWFDALRKRALLPPGRPSPDIVRDRETEPFLVFRDGFPKAQLHYLVMAREERLVDIYALRGETDADLVRKMAAAALEEARVGVESEPRLRKLADSLDDCFMVGFHRLPSMRQLHLHVISRDFYSDSLKKKVHFVSYNTDYFLPASTAEHLLRTVGRIDCSEGDKTRYEAMSKTSTLHCNQCDETFNGTRCFSDLKKHLFSHWSSKRPR